jgi:hypothetical protein
MNLNNIFIYGTYPPQQFDIIVGEDTFSAGDTLAAGDGSILLVVRKGPIHIGEGIWIDKNTYRVESLVTQEDIEIAINHFKRLLDWGLIV